MPKTRATDFIVDIVTGLLGMGLAGLTNGRLSIKTKPRPTHQQIGSLNSYFTDRLSIDQILDIRKQADAANVTFHDALMNAAAGPKSHSTADCSSVIRTRC